MTITPCLHNSSTPCRQRTKDQGASPYFSIAIKAKGPGGFPLYHSITPKLHNSATPCRQRNRDRGASPYFSKAIQATSPGGRPLYHSITPSIGSSAHRTRDGGPPLVSQHFLGSQTSRLQAGASTPAQ